MASPRTYQKKRHRDEYTIHFQVRLKKDVSVPKNVMETEELLLWHDTGL